MDAPLVKQGPLFLVWAKASERGHCDACTDNPEPTIEADYAVALMRFGQYVVALCGPCLRRLKNQIRRAEG